ncbi:hypothetical protein PR048_024239 [Dryococelus australis]|uniref:Uncharacterized protein n=1 Tax=Dryococelus australis TaxID=614101 RepID=A0ABQ9GN15_9NEOP|nr:hypothetical protein PR048_024239 [Dryococelus australis]
MYPDTYRELYHRLLSLLRKEDTKFRKTITADEKLLITLRYLVTGSSLRDLSFHFLRGNIVKDVCTAIWSAL